MSKPIYLDREGVEAIVKKIEASIEELQNVAGEIDSQMYSLEECWRGNAHDKAMDTYEESYKAMLKEKVPETVKELNEFIKTCKQAIVDVDAQLSGNG